MARGVPGGAPPQRRVPTTRLVAAAAVARRTADDAVEEAAALVAVARYELGQAEAASREWCEACGTRASTVWVAVRPEAVNF